MKITVIAPVSDRGSGTTLPHPHFPAMLASIQAGGHTDFECLVLADGPMPRAAQIVQELGDSRFAFVECVKRQCWGHPQRNVGIARARGDVIWFCDDDDSAAEGALAVIAEATTLHPGSPLLFRMRQHQAADGSPVLDPPRVLWEHPGQFAMGKIGTPCFVVPNIPRLIGTWGDMYEADFYWGQETIAKFTNAGHPPEWIDRVVCEVRPWARNP